MTHVAGHTLRFALGWLLISMGAAHAVDELNTITDFETLRRTGMLIMPGEIDSSKTNLLIDTGATTTYLDITLEARVAKNRTKTPVRITTGSATERGWKYASVPVFIRGLESRSVDAIPGDLSGLRELVGGVDVRGVAGMTYLRNSCLTSEGGLVRLTDTKTKAAMNPGNMAYRMTTNVAGCPSIPVNFPVLGDRDALIDTGYQDFLGISESHANALIRSGNAVQLSVVRILTASGVVEQQLLAIRELTVCGVKYHNIPAVMGTTTKLGLEFVRSRDMVINFQTMTLTMLVQSEGVRAFPVDASGIRFFWKDNAYYVRRIEDESPASIAGIRTGDRLIRIDGNPLQATAIWDIREKLSASGSSVKLDLARGDQEFTLQMPLAYGFEYPPQWKPVSNEADEFFNALKEQSND
jgi:predicted aspartyl protease